MSRLKLIDGIIKEPLGGAHTDREKTYKSVEAAIKKAYKELSELSVDKLVKQRMEKYANMGVFKG